MKRRGARRLLILIKAIDTTSVYKSPTEEET